MKRVLVVEYLTGRREVVTIQDRQPAVETHEHQIVVVPETGTESSSVHDRMGFPLSNIRRWWTELKED